MNQLEEICLEKVRKQIESDPWFLRKILYPLYRFKPFHRKWFEQALLDEEEICLGPRNFAKTTVRGIIWVIHQMIQNPNIQLGIVSDTGPQAIHFVSEVKMQIERNTLLTLLYPYLKPGNLWRDNEFTIKGATAIQKGATVTAFGYGEQPATSLMPSWWMTSWTLKTPEPSTSGISWRTGLA